MKNLINILGVLLFVFSIISCGNESANDNRQVPTVVKENDIQNKTQILETLKKNSLFYAKAEQFEYLKNSNPLNITKIVFSPIMLTNSDSPIICKEILKFIGEEKLVFNSSEEVLSNEEITEEYMLKEKGKITIGDNKYSANLYFNGDADENHAFFSGKIIFSIPSIKSLEGESISIEIKGKK